MRGRVHVALAARGSRIALYDLRESLEAAAPATSFSGPLPVDFLAALSTAGDASCLEAVTAAYARTGPGGPETTPGGAIGWPTHSGRS